jgi:DNA invertase Pin-like site-specific DNA recombinase
MKQFISYTRVSTAKQGLGLEAQAAIIDAYVKAQGGTIIAAYEEKESGKETINRPALQEAIARCKSECCTIVVAKLDRLSRDIVDIFTLKKDKALAFEVCDMDASDTLTLGIFATLAQKERELISKRTKEALAALKAGGVQLGNPNAAETMRKYNHMGAEARKRAANESEANRHAYAAIKFMPGTLAEKAAYLNENGYKTRQGKQFNPMQVKRLIDRFSTILA